MSEKLLDPKTPKEYLEALLRLVRVAQESEMPDGDGIGNSDSEKVATYTDIFQTIKGCADCALENIRMFGIKFCPQHGYPAPCYKCGWNIKEK